MNMVLPTHPNVHGDKSKSASSGYFVLTKQTIQYRLRLLGGFVTTVLPTRPF